MFVAYTDANGVIGFSDELLVPPGMMVFVTGHDMAALQTRVQVKARHAYADATYLVPGVPEAEDADAGHVALEAWAKWAFPEAPVPYLALGDGQ